MRKLTATGHEGFSFLQIKTEQPEVLNPKTGKPYDLKDPEFPIVAPLEHKFKWAYWRMPKTSQAIMLEYMDERWGYFNRTRFGGRLTKPKLSLLKDVNALKMRLRGLWKSSRTSPPGELLLSPNLFNAPHEGWVNRTLIKELA